MASTLTWLAHDEAERRRMQEAVELFREQGTLDDLGVGSVRDAFSNLLFPGTSVLHTRARYLLLIPWIYRRLEREGVSSRDVAARARRDEVRLIAALLAGGETRGVMGERARAELKLLPSTAYWSGLGVLGFRLFSGTQDQYHRSFDGYRTLLRSAPRVRDDEEPVAGGFINWHPAVDALAEQDPDFLEQTTFVLSDDEGSLVRELVLQHTKDSFLAYLCASSSHSTVRFPWLHTRAHTSPTVIRRQLELAQTFSAVMQGASLLYNLMLAQKRQMVELAGQLTDQLGDWADELPSEVTAFGWDEFWLVASRGNPRISGATRSFVETWATRVRDLGAGVSADAGTRQLVERRERQTKHAQARLANPRRLETWTEPVGMGRLDYRWPVVREVINDIAQATRRATRART